MKIHDISMNIHANMTVYKNKEEKKPIIEVQSDFNTGSVYESSITMNMHTGTHIDAALHMIENGSTMESFDLHKVITPCKVLDLTHIREKITKEALEYFSIKEDDFILFKTRNSLREDFDLEFVYLEKSGAEYLKEKKIKGVGIDALGIERAQPNHETHKLLLREAIVILEGLRLKDINEGDYFLFAAPLKILEAEATPTRAILIEGLNN